PRGAPAVARRAVDPRSSAPPSSRTMNHGNLARVAPPPAPHHPTPARLTGIAGGKAPAAPRPALRTSAGLNWGTLAIVVVLVAINVAGAPYYLRSIAERVRHPMHALLRPSG